MGRELSELERYILGEAGKRPRVYHAEVLAGFFGWRPLRPLQYEGGHLHSPGSPRFSGARIGKERYAKVKAALAGACRRLEAIGLVSRRTGPARRWAGVEITAEGQEWLAASTGAASTGCNPRGAKPATPPANQPRRG
jgi:hypothetical protein